MVAGVLGPGPVTAVACPTCGSDTRVIETRRTSTGLRRRRACTREDCPGRITGRITTIEVPVSVGDRQSRSDEPYVLVHASELRAMRDLATAVLAIGDRIDLLAAPIPEPPVVTDADPGVVTGTRYRDHADSFLDEAVVVPPS